MLQPAGELAYSGASATGVGTVNKVLFCAVFVVASAPAALAQGACSGEACAAVVMAADGCQWTNKGDKSVRLSLSMGQSAPMVTVLAPGETFKQADKAKCAGGVGRYEASFPALRTMPDEAVAAVRPKPKPTLVASPALVPAQPVAVAALPAATAVDAGPVLPRVKPAAPPAYPPVPRSKPAVVAATLVAPSTAVSPAAAVALSGPACVEGDKACPPILFKTFDSCVWVLNLNPRPVAFEAMVGGKALSLSLEAADGDKADARAAAGGKVSKNDAAFHMRLRDPFQSAGSGIPIFRARLGGASGCVKARSDVAEFTAKYVQ